MKNFIIFIILLIFSNVVLAEKKTLVCTIYAAQDFENDEILDTSTWKERTWVIDYDNKIVISASGKKWRTTFHEHQIKWGLCKGEEYNLKPNPIHCEPLNLSITNEDNFWDNMTAGNTYISSGFVNTVNRNTLSYRECINDKGFICRYTYKGNCQIIEEKKL